MLRVAFPRGERDGREGRDVCCTNVLLRFKGYRAVLHVRVTAAGEVLRTFFKYGRGAGCVQEIASVAARGRARGVCVWGGGGVSALQRKGPTVYCSWGPSFTGNKIQKKK